MLTVRQQKILNIVVGDYIKEATPIASESISRNYQIDVSSATVRSEVVTLEEQGYLKRPYSSAGSVPQDKAYRQYVESVAMEFNEIPQTVRASLREHLTEVERSLDEWTSVCAALLARLVGNLAIATFPKAREARVKHIELIPVQRFLALLIIVLEQTRLRRQLIRLREPMERTELEALSNKLKYLVTGHTWREIEPAVKLLPSLEGELVEAAVVMLKEEDRPDTRDQHLAGLRNLLAQPEFAENDQMGVVVEGIEDGTLAQAVLDQMPEERAVRVVIGQENSGDLMWPLSVVIGRYGIPGHIVGAVGAIGPVRMEYNKTIAGVELMASMMSELVESVHSS